MFLDVLGVFGCFFMFLGVFGCFWMFLGVFECFWLFLDVLGYFWMVTIKGVSRKFQECLKEVFKGYKEVSWKFLRAF